MTQGDANQQDQTNEQEKPDSLDFPPMSEEDKAKLGAAIEQMLGNIKNIVEDAQDEPGVCYACHRAELETLAMPSLAGYVMTDPNRAEELAKAMRLAINVFTGVTEVRTDE